MSGFAFFPPNFVLVNSSGRPHAGAVARFYRAGTTTGVTVYATADLATPLGTSVTADSAGVFPAVFIDPSAGAYKVSFFTSAGTLIRTVDNLPATLVSAAAIGLALYPRSAAEISAGVTPTDYTQPYGWVTRFGAVGDGSTNDLTAINNCARAATNGGRVYFPEGYTFGINGIIEILNSTREVTGRGTIKCLSNGNTAPSGLMLKGTGHGASVNVSHCRVHGLRIDRNNQWAFGIYAANATNIQITDNEIFGCDGTIANQYAAILCPALDLAVDAPHDVLIANNYIVSDSRTSVVGGCDGIQVAGSYSVAPYGSLPDKWKATFEPPTTTSACYNIVISGNLVVGGYYGISLVETRYSSVVGNECVSNIRGIVQQSNCYANLIEANVIRECNSSGIMGGYGVYDSLIKGNRIYSTRAQGEGLLQLYVGCDRNVIDGNYTFSSDLSPGFHIYIAIHANGNIVRNNTSGGTCGKAYIGLESAWDKDVAIATHYAYGFVVTTFEDFANAASAGNAIERNTVNGSSAVPAIWVAQINSNATACGLTGTRIVGNTVAGSGYTCQLRLYEETASSLSGVILKDNLFDAAATPASFLWTRGRAHMSACDGNTIINAGTAATPFNSTADADATPSVAYSDYWVFGNTGATNVTNFDDGMAGQEILVRGDANTTLVHAADKIVLNGATNAAMTAATKLMRLKNIGGIWFEVSRNF